MTEKTNGDLIHIQDLITLPMEARNVPTLYPDVEIAKRVFPLIQAEFGDPKEDGIIELQDCLNKIGLIYDVREEWGPYKVMSEEWERWLLSQVEVKKEFISDYYKYGLGTIFNTMDNHTNVTQLVMLETVGVLLACIELNSFSNPFNPPMKVLDLGGGCGALTIYLKVNGFDVSYSDVEGSWTETIAEYRFERRSLEIPFWDGGEIPGAVVCLEVLEHLWNPISFLVNLSGKMRIGECLISSESFSDICQPVHLDRNWIYQGRVYFSIMENLGFERVPPEDLISVMGEYGYICNGLQLYFLNNVLKVFKKEVEIPLTVLNAYKGREGG